MTARNDITGDALRSKGATNSYRDGWDRIFGKKAEEPEPAAEAPAVQAEPRNYIASRRPGPYIGVPEAVSMILEVGEVIHPPLQLDVVHNFANTKNLLIRVTDEALEGLKAKLDGWHFSVEQHYKLPNARLSVRLYDEPLDDHHD